MSTPRHPSQSVDSHHSPDQDVDSARSEPVMPDIAMIAPQRRSPKRPVGVQPGFKVLVGLTLITALLLLPFAFSHNYLDWMRSESVELHHFLRGELYKQSTGYGALAFVLVEILLTARKRSRSWIGRIKIPGSMNLWRTIHIFVGVGLVALVLIHTFGANGLNFNGVFLWVFFITTLTALVGVVAETGILESTRSMFGRFPGSDRPITKGPLIRGLRAIWLVSHIFFVCVFVLMLTFHIFLAYYYQ